MYLVPDASRICTTDDENKFVDITMTTELQSSLKVALRRIHSHTPRIHCITNDAATTLTANVLLAIGAHPSMTTDSAEIINFIEQSDAISINLGMLNDGKRNAIRNSARAAKRINKPWVLDPVMIDFSESRLNFCQYLLRYNPTVIRGNESEIKTLETATRLTCEQLNKKFSAIIAITGKLDHVVTEEASWGASSGHHWMSRVTGMGCALSALIAAFVSQQTDYYQATTDAISLYGMAGEQAAEKAAGPGSFMARFTDALYHIQQNAIE